jgi:hypothetical protein
MNLRVTHGDSQVHHRKFVLSPSNDTRGTVNIVDEYPTCPRGVRY